MVRNQSKSCEGPLSDQKFERGFVTNGSQRKTRHSTQTALVAMSASVWTGGSTAYDAFGRSRDDFILTLDGFESGMRKFHKKISLFPSIVFSFNLTPIAVSTMQNVESKNTLSNVYFSQRMGCLINI